MKIFGKSFGDYIRFQKPVLIAILIIGLFRLILSLAGVPVGSVRFLSMTVVVLIGVFYYGIQVPKTGFGTYRHLLPLTFNQAALANGIAIVGIFISMATGQPNVFTAPEYGGTATFHWVGHILFGTILFGSLLGWGISSLVMLVTKKVTRRSAAAIS